ncbi:MAG: cupin domain-containing protein [Thermoleophilia bacterium]|nr:cupin domain-containing protein [Thermoleophilia bacterium]
MKSVNLGDVAAGECAAAADHPQGRTTRRVHGADGQAIRQVLVTLRDGGALADHENPGDASLLVLRGRVRVEAGDDVWEGGEGDFLVIPDRRHNLRARGDAAVLLSFARVRPAPVGPEGA